MVKNFKNKLNDLHGHVPFTLKEEYILEGKEICLTLDKDASPACPV